MNRTTEKGVATHETKRTDRVDPQSKKSKFRPWITSSYSEASWNGQMALSPGVFKDTSPSERNKVNGKRPFLKFIWKCSCSHQKSVDIDVQVEANKCSRNRKRNMHNGRETMQAPWHIKTNPIISSGIINTKTNKTIPNQNLEMVSVGSQQDVNLALTIAKAGVPNVTAVKQCEELEKEGSARKSLEVFGSPLCCKGDKAKTLKRLSMFAWDLNPGLEDIPPTSASSTIQDDDKSDSSSDLFEIQSLSGNVHQIFRGQI